MRKRRINPGPWSLKAWTSAHVYLGLSLVVVGTLHTGFQIGWNVHTLAYVLMLLVIATGIYGVVVYATLPTRLSDNRREMTRAQMLDALNALDRQLDSAAQPLARGEADLVLAGGVRLRGRHVELKELTVAGVTAWQVPALLVPASEVGVDGLLGLSFLRRFRLSLGPEGLHLREP